MTDLFATGKRRIMRDSRVVESSLLIAGGGCQALGRGESADSSGFGRDEAAVTAMLGLAHY
jgi:hypothetical protein